MTPELQAALMSNPLSKERIEHAKLAADEDVLETILAMLARLEKLEKAARAVCDHDQWGPSAGSVIALRDALASEPGDADAVVLEVCETSVDQDGNRYITLGGPRELIEKAAGSWPRQPQQVRVSIVREKS